MNIIGFSHHYDKIHGQTHGKLLSVDFVNYFDIPTEGLCYDVLCTDENGNKFHAYDIFASMDGDSINKLVQFTFMGNDMIPFTTYRQMSNNPDVFGKYENLVGQEFAFKFKGEELPKELAEKVSKTKNCVKIFD